MPGRQAELHIDVTDRSRRKAHREVVMSDTLNPDFRVGTVRWTAVHNLTDPVDRGLVTYQRDQGYALKNGKLQQGRGLAQRFRKYGDKFLTDRWSYPEVSRRTDGVLAVMNGNGRCHFALKKKGRGYLVPYLEYEGMSLADEVTHFLAQRHAKQLTTADYDQAEVKAGVPEVLAMHAAVEEVGFEVGTKHGQLSVGTANLLKGSGYLRPVLDVLSAVRDSHPSDPASKLTHRGYVLAIQALLANPEVNNEDVREVLVKWSPSTLIADSQGAGAEKFIAERVKSFIPAVQ